MLYSTLLFLSFCMDFGIAETGIARGSPPGTTTEVLRFGAPFAEILVVSNVVQWMLLKFGAPKKCIQVSNTTIASFYVPKVSEMLRNTPKHHLGSNVVEWMLLNFSAPKKCIRPETQVLHLFMLWKLAKCSETLQISFWVECSRMYASKLLP
jgi:hypothetical protein